MFFEKFQTIKYISYAQSFALVSKIANHNLILKDFLVIIIVDVWFWCLHFNKTYGFQLVFQLFIIDK